MNFISRKPWDPSLHKLTDEAVYQKRSQHRREFLASLGIGAAGILGSSILPGCGEHKPDTEKLKAAAEVPVTKAAKEIYPATRNEEFTYGRAETIQQEAAIYTNFYEFSMSKQTYEHVDRFQPTPWEIKVGGLCAKPMTFDMDELYKRFAFEERAYRHRCVETWAMCVPWTGFQLHQMLKLVEPEPKAKYVQFETFNRPTEARNMVDSSFPWPYTEGLTIEEAMNELTFLATGIYGEPLPKQHGAPVRLVLPWKYGFKSIKSIVQITLTDQPPKTFWNVVNPREYGFEANVDPKVPHPRWSQAEEWMLGTRERFPTVKFNGYGDFVAKLYG